MRFPEVVTMRIFEFECPDCGGTFETETTGDIPDKVSCEYCENSLIVCGQYMVLIVETDFSGEKNV